ncbi:MAG: CapA family protein [Candidatus Nanosyncoccaceae bacterium]|jgi:poly-gamma-glutamate synthesis protein (capsule biosynthesis protein)
MAKKFSSKRLALILLLILLIFSGGMGYLLWQKQQIRPTDTTPTKSEKKKLTPPSLQITFAAMGDMLAHDTVNQQAKTDDGYDYKPYFEQIKPLYSDVDVVFCNPETLSAGANFGISGYPTFNAPTEFARDLSASGCQVINLATNHIADKTPTAVSKTIDVWQNQTGTLAVAGANKSAEEQQQVAYFEKNGLKVAFVAFAQYSNRATSSTLLNLYSNTTLVNQLMSEARANADIVLVSLHWGTEDSTTVNSNQINIAKTFANLGADVIIGTGPHVLQKVDWVDGKDGHKTLVWYSIGNMLSSQIPTNNLTGGVAGWTAKKVDDKIQISDVNFKPTFMSYDWPAGGNLLSRHNLQLQPLKTAEPNLAKHKTTYDDRLKFVTDTIGPNAQIISN